MSGRAGLTRFELVATVFVAVLAVVGIAALVPTGPQGERSGAGHSASAATRLDDGELAGPRAAAGLPPCPTEDPSARPQVARFAGVEVPCLGAPGTVRPAAALAGRETLLNVWASWCVPCREELPAMAWYAAQPGAPSVLGVDVRDNPVTALKLLTDLKVHLPMLADSGDALAGALRVVALPASFLVRADGTVVQLLPQVAYTAPDEVAAAVAKARQAGR